MVSKAAVAAALKSVPGARASIAPQSSGWGKIPPIAAEMYTNSPYRGSYGPFMPRVPATFSDGAFGPMPPIQPVPVDNPPPGGMYPDPRWWQYRQGWNLPTPPGTEGLKLASFDQLKTLADKYSVARACIELRKSEIVGLEWEITLTKEAAKAYQGDHHANRVAGEKIAQLTKFFNHPDPDFWSFDSFLGAFLEEIFVYDALALIFRPKYGEKFGMGGRGLLGSSLDSLRLVSGPTIRPLVDMHGGHPVPPSPAYQQYLYGVPRSDYLSIMRGDDIEDSPLAGTEYNEFTSDLMLYAPHWPIRESPYGFPPVERALIPIISGLQKQEFQLDYFSEGSVPAVYISPGDPNITPTQIRELQDALNGIAGDPAYHLKVVVLPPGSKVDPQRPVDLSDSFDTLIMEQVTMAFDIQPMELGIIPDIGGGQQGPSASSIRFATQESRDIKSRKSTKPLLKFVSAIFNYVIQDICRQPDLQFQFEGLADEADKQAITELGVQQVQNGIASIDEVRDRLDLAPWGLSETSEPVVFTAQGPIPFSMAPQLIAAMQGVNNSSSSGGKKSNSGTQSTNSGQRTTSTRSRTSQPSVRRGGQTKPNGSHPAPVSPHRESLTPAHSAAGGAVQSSTPRTGGSTSRSSVAGSRKKAVNSELDALRRHMRKDRNAVYNWEPKHIDTLTLAKIADDINAGMLIDMAINRAADLCLMEPLPVMEKPADFQPAPREWQQWPLVNFPPLNKAEQWPGWEHDLGLVGAYKQRVAKAFKEADGKGSELRQKAATGQMYVSGATLRSLIAEEVKDTFLNVLEPLWRESWNLGYEAAKSLVTGNEADFTKSHNGENLDNFIGTEGEHWLDQISRTGLKIPDARSEIIARSEVARAMNAAAIQAYRDHGVTYKEMLLAPDDACDICKNAAMLGEIPLDSIFPGGGLGGPMHPSCRCVPAPAGMDLVPPQGHIGKAQDKSRAAFLMMRAPHPETGKYHYLLQKRDDGTGWGLPGGSAHIGEDLWDTACRECTEEIGDLPPLKPVMEVHQLKGDGGIAVIYLCEVPWFAPKMNGATPEETHGTGWFKRKEVKDLDLHPAFRKQWENIHWDDVDKATRTVVNEMGERLTIDDPGLPLYPAGARWPYPRRSDGAEDPHYGTAETPEPPGRDPARNGNMWDGPSSQVYEDDDTTDFPRGRTRNRGPKRNPEQGGRRWPDTSTGGPQSDTADIGAVTGVSPGKKTAPRPVVGSVPAQAPKPVSPRSVPPVVVDPGDNVERWSDEGESDVVAQGKTAESDTRLADPDKPGGPSDYSDPNPVNAEHVMNLMRSNFPEDAIQWVMRARWIGPIQVPWERIDIDGVDSWAASHQPDAVARFAKDIKAGTGHTNPSILIQDNDSPKAIIIDGHHRALAHHKLGQPILAYLGIIEPGDRQAAEETHSKQVHSGSDLRNKL